MHIHYIQHEPFEAPGYFLEWMAHQKHTVSATLIYEKAEFPSVDSLDVLLVMGGSMGANDDALYAWMPAEKAFIAACLAANKKVIGICLGAQLLAAVLGARVFKNANTEIGWFDVTKTSKGIAEPILNKLPTRFTTMHWHGDTFAIPEGAIHLFKSEACVNQAFIYKNKALALQFHPEMTQATLAGMIEASESIPSGPYTQSVAQMQERMPLCEQNHAYLTAMLNAFVAAPLVNS